MRKLVKVFVCKILCRSVEKGYDFMEGEFNALEVQGFDRGESSF